MKGFGGALLGLGLLALIVLQEGRLAVLGIAGGIFFFLLGLVIDPLRNAQKARNAEEAAVQGLARQLDTIRLEDGETRQMPTLQAQMKINGRGWSPVAILATNKRLIVQPLERMATGGQRFDVHLNAADSISTGTTLLYPSKVLITHQGTSFEFGKLNPANVEKLHATILAGRGSLQAEPAK